MTSNTPKSSFVSTKSGTRNVGTGLQPPVAKLFVGAIRRYGARAHRLRVVYRDPNGIDPSTVDGRDLFITGPKGFRQIASLADVNVGQDGQRAIATYRILAPTGLWNFLDNGTYTISMRPNQVSNQKNVFVKQGRLGQFQVSAPRPRTLPTATMAGATIRSGGGKLYRFRVTYRDLAGLDVSTLDGTDLLVTGPDGFRQRASLVTYIPRRLNRAAIATYQIKAPGGSWDFADNGLYSIQILGRQVRSRSGAFVRSGKIGSFRVGVPKPIDPATIAPTVSGFTSPDIVTHSGAAYFTVTYADNLALDASSFDSNDILITGPNDFQQFARLVRMDDGNGTPRTVTYRIDAPGGIWTAAANGTYTISVRPDEVKDSNGNAVKGDVVGTFQVNATNPPPQGENQTFNGTSEDDIFLGTTGSNTLNGSSGSDTADYSQVRHGIVANLSTGKVLKLAYGGLSLPRVMPLGDSITSGQHREPARPGAYRIRLYDQLTDDGIRIDLVGSQTNGPDNGFDRNHEGRPGWTINQITGLIDNPGFFDPYQPDILLIMLGTNDASNDSVSQMSSDIRSLIDELSQQLPNALLLVSSIPPIDPTIKGETRAQRGQQFNNALPGIISQKAAEGKRVAFVNAGGQLTLDMLNGDGLHPDSAGYDKLGDLWYEAIAKQGVLFNGQDTLNSVENLVGTAFGDTLIGNSGVNVMEGGKGNDLITGGGGADIFVYRGPDEGEDIITDFGNGADSFRISASGFGGGLKAGIALSNGVAASTGVFVQGSTPVGASANFLYNNGVLRFDPDGVGNNAGVTLARLQGSPTLTADRFQIVA